MAPTVSLFAKGHAVNCPQRVAFIVPSTGRRLVTPQCTASNPDQERTIAPEEREAWTAFSRRETLGLSIAAVSTVVLGARPSQAIQGLTAGRIPGLSKEPDQEGFYMYVRPEGKSGGHGVGWSEIPPYKFRVPKGWEEIPVSIADLGGTEIDLRYQNKEQGDLAVVVAPVLRFMDVGFNAWTLRVWGLRKGSLRDSRPSSSVGRWMRTMCCPRRWPLGKTGACTTCGSSSPTTWWPPQQPRTECLSSPSPPARASGKSMPQTCGSSNRASACGRINQAGRGVAWAEEGFWERDGNKRTTLQRLARIRIGRIGRGEQATMRPFFCGSAWGVAVHRTDSPGPAVLKAVEERR
ncbi:hypothetical protein VaNZ11_014098 [Volvox africanus]|uniref:PsbP C-terminal domain-containing protein n=1 Tax=Volvox africanus TaxID=51714 RepID=A0ABQ5SJL2_9CHLO|nr:hypothetical protein VaNZ11_014098 [Volvox africanus]